MSLALIFLSLWQTASASPVPTSNCILTEGVGNDEWRIGVTKRDKAGPTLQGVMLDYKQNVLDLIFVTGYECRTSKGIKVGDSEIQAQKVYGKGRKTVAYLMKGKSDLLGQFGDVVLQYRGVEFVISDGKVVAMVILAAKAQGP